MTRTLFFCAVLAAACGSIELLTARPAAVVAESYEACIERNVPTLAVPGIGAEILASLLRSACGPARCDGACDRCIDDLDCGPFQLCEGFRCGGCPDLSDCIAPAGLSALPRNGCRVCEFAPASDCLTEADCGAGQRCVQGKTCASGCDRLDCCANVCSDSNCPGRAPLGCIASCGDAFPDSVACLTTRCDCVAGQWGCAVGPGLAAAPCSYSP